ncbi:NUDIX hydrolase domain-like protein [Xylaria longipes]|nr:NUDIX hydrolase domain-like protein [Xylaria longipes]RYC61743.1 hypothetical protein CHU98_g4457 [Xylaria longipes]
MSNGTKTYLELVKECDTLPYPDEVGEYTNVTSEYYHFRLMKAWRDGNNDVSSSYATIGYILPSVVANMPWTDKFRVDHGTRTVSIPWPTATRGGVSGSYETQAIAEQLERARESDSVPILRKWRAEPYKILGLEDCREVRIARAGSAVFGVHTRGVHALGYCRVSDSDNDMRLWIPRRSSTKQTFPGMLDNTVGGGLTADEDVLGCLAREAQEEASLPEAWVLKHARPVGTISYFSIRDERAGGPDEVGLLQPATQILYDLELPADMVPQPLDGEVAEFLLWTPKQTMMALRDGQFKLNSAVAWIDFLIRHGYITALNEPEYLELVARIHRRICF